MDPKHHLTDALLMAYSAGTLSEAFNLVVASHISMCDECRARLASLDAVGGCLLEEDSGALVTEASLSNVLDIVRNAPVVSVRNATPHASQEDSRVPAPLAPYIGGHLDKVKWKPVGMGVKQAILPTSSEATARLLYIPAGTAVPDHGHRGTELTLVLQGAFEDEDGYYARGDIEVATEETDHTPIADVSEDCICLAVTDAPLRFRSFLPRLVQPFLKI